MPSWKVYCTRCGLRVCIAWPVDDRREGRAFRVSDVITCRHVDPWASDFDFGRAIVGLDPVLRVQRRT